MNSPLVAAGISDIPSYGQAVSDLSKTLGGKRDYLQRQQRQGQQQHSGQQQQQHRRRGNSTRRDTQRTKIVIGKNVSNGLMSFKGADLTISQYIGRVSNGTTIQNVRDYVTHRNVEIVDLEQLSTRHDQFQSYKLVVKKTELEKIEREDFWPEGVLSRRFFQPRQRDSAETQQQHHQDA